jgi:hypothetical protein
MATRVSFFLNANFEVLDSNPQSQRDSGILPSRG